MFPFLDLEQTKILNSSTKGRDLAESPDKKTADLTEDVAEASLEDIDKLLAEEDPEFNELLSQVGKDTNLSLSQITASEADNALSDAREKWQNSGLIGRNVYSLFPMVASLTVRFGNLKFSIRAFLIARWIRLKNFGYFLATDGKNLLLAKAKMGMQATGASLGKRQDNFKKLSWKMKLAFFGILIAMGATFTFIYRSFTRGVIPIGDELFVPNLEKYATHVEEYNPETDTEAFYDNLRSIKNILELPKMVVNLRPSKNSGKNPMGAFEFYLEGNDPEVVVELKDREVEIRDRVQRTLEEFTFDQAADMDGKKDLVEKLTKEINSLLSTGKIKKVWFKTVIVKP